MGWAVGYDTRWSRDIGYGVPAWCDHPQCDKVIDRGLAYVCCDQEPYGGVRGCGLYFCSDHTRGDHQCTRCYYRSPKGPFRPKRDHPSWLRHVLTDESWREWRITHVDEADAMRVLFAEYVAGDSRWADPQYGIDDASTD